MNQEQTSQRESVNALKEINSKLEDVASTIQEPAAEYENKDEDIKDKYIRALEEKRILLQENYELKLAIERLQKKQSGGFANRIKSSRIYYWESNKIIKMI